MIIIEGDRQMFIKVISGKLCYHMLIVGIFEDIWELINFLGDLF